MSFHQSNNNNNNNNNNSSSSSSSSSPSSSSSSSPSSSQPADQQMTDAQVVTEVMTNFDGYHLAEYARQVNQANGKPDSRNTQALGRVDGDVEMFTQRSYNTHEEQLDAIHTQTGGRVSVQTTHIADNKEDEGIHAEMLLVSEWLLGEIGRPSSVGASQPVCARCARVLTILGISHPQTDGHVTKNWVHPIRHAKYVDFNDELSARGLTSAEFASLTHDLPQKVTNKREYGW